MGRYKIEFAKDALKGYKKLSPQYKKLIDKGLGKIANELSADVKSLKGTDDIFRLRIGKYRILFYKENNTIIIAKISSRGDAYK